MRLLLRWLLWNRIRRNEPDRQVDWFLPDISGWRFGQNEVDEPDYDHVDGQGDREAVDGREVPPDEPPEGTGVAPAR